MDKLIELLQQIQDLSGVAIDALKGAAGGEKPEGKPEGGPPHEGGKPPMEGKPEGGPPEGGGKPPMGDEEPPRR